MNRLFYVLYKIILCCYHVLGVVLDLVLKPVTWVYFKSRGLVIYFGAGLPAGARVLDVGSGSNPWFRSDVLLEKFPLDDTERGGPLKTQGKKIIIGDACAMPFQDKEFDFVYASHVAEHIDDIEKFFQEIQRVGKAGYIETPNAIFEQTVGTTTHLWALWVENGVYTRKGSGLPVHPRNTTTLRTRPYKRIAPFCFLSLQYQSSRQCPSTGKAVSPTESTPVQDLWITQNLRKIPAFNLNS